MANEGIFITKNGVVLPVVTEMSTSNWAAYQNDLVLPLLRNTNHLFDVFEGFKYRGDINENVPAEFIFNAKTNYTPQFTLGGGTLNTSNGRITPSSNPLQVKEANKVFLVNSTFQTNQLVSGDDVALRIESIDALSRITLNIDTHALAFFKANVSTFTDTPSITEPENILVEVTDADITFSAINTPATLYSLPRTFTAKVVSGAIGVLTSSGTATGNAIPFGTSETLEAADAVVTGTLSIESSFGQLTTYDVKIGESIVQGAGPDVVVPLTFTAGQAGSHHITDDYAGGVGEIKYAVQSGSLPAGMTLTSAGYIQGTPTSDGIYTVVINVTDDFGNSINIQYQITVQQSSNVAYNAPAGVEDVPYTYNPDISGVQTVTVASGAIPTGLTLDEDTGALNGTPSAAGTYSFTLSILSDADVPETVDVTITIYDTSVAEVLRNGDSAGIVPNGSSVEVHLSEDLKVDMSGGSGSFQYSITGDNSIDSDGNIEVFNPGIVTITIVDTITGQQTQINLNVAGQGDVCGLAVVEDAPTEESAPCSDILTDCHTPVTIGFNAMQILKGIDPTDIAYREFPSFDQMTNCQVQNNGKAFVMFRSQNSNAWAVANNGHDGQNFVYEFALDASIANASGDFAVGITKEFSNESLAGLDFACVITTVSGERKVEIRQANVYQSGSRFDIAEGQQVGFGVFSDKITLYIDGILKYTLTSNTFSCSGVDIILFATAMNMICGGRAGNLIYDLATPGTPTEVGILDAQTGLYTPALSNVGYVKIVGYSTVNINVYYVANVRVIRGAVKASLENAMIEGIPVDMYIAGINRKDDLPMRLDREGRPDRNQFENIRHLGTLGGSGKMAMTATRNDFRNDRGATSTSLIFDKVVITGSYLNVRDIPTVKDLVPYMKETNSHGVRRLRQYSSGCHKRMRVLLVWQAPNCEDIDTFDAVEILNGLSYTMFDLEIGQGVQSNLPISIEGFPDKDGIILDYNQFDKHYHRIGAAN